MTSSSVLVLSVSSPVVASCLLWTGVTSAEVLVLVSESSLNGLCRKVGLRESEVVLDGGAPTVRTGPESLTTVCGSDALERGALTGSVRSPSR